MKTFKWLDTEFKLVLHKSYFSYNKLVKIWCAFPQTPLYIYLYVTKAREPGGYFIDEIEYLELYNDCLPFRFSMEIKYNQENYNCYPNDIIFASRSLDEVKDKVEKYRMLE